MGSTVFDEMVELLRETFEGAKPGEGTQYLDRDGGIRATLARFTAAHASARVDGHPSVAAHARHMAFHLRTAYQWIQGDHSKRDWKGSFEPQTVTEAEWSAVRADLDSARTELIDAMRALPAERFLADAGGGLGVVAHLAYHLGAIRQRLPAG